MFESGLVEEAAPGAALRDEDWFDPAWLDEVPWSDGPPEPQPPVSGCAPSGCAPSGWLALELDHATVDPPRLSDTELIDTIVGFDRVASWASARQASLLAEFARRRPADDSQPTHSDLPSRCSESTPDEIGLALRLSQTTAANRLVMAQVLVADLPGTLAAWEAGTIDALKTRAITETSYLLPTEQRAALEARVLPRAGTQTVSQLRAALARAVLVLDPDGAADRHEQRRADRRVVLGADGDGMATLWALLSAPDATAAYQRLCRLARSLGADDPRGMDARRADLLIDLLTGRRCAATADLLDRESCTNGEGCAHPDGPHGCACTPDTDSTPDTGHPHTSGDAPTTRSAGTGAGPGKPLISVIVPISTLLGLDEHPGELVGYGPIPAHLAREIAADGTWRRLLTTPPPASCSTTGAPPTPTGRADRLRPRPRPVLPQPHLRPACRHRRPRSHHRLERRRPHQRTQPLRRVPPRPPDQDLCPRLARRPAPRRANHLDHPHRTHLHQPPPRLPPRPTPTTNSCSRRSRRWRSLRNRRGAEPGRTRSRLRPAPFLTPHASDPRRRGLAPRRAVDGRWVGTVLGYMASGVTSWPAVTVASEHHE